MYRPASLAQAGGPETGERFLLPEGEPVVREAVGGERRAHHGGEEGDVFAEQAAAQVSIASYNRPATIPLTIVR